jgi:hypothetical protein
MVKVRVRIRVRVRVGVRVSVGQHVAQDYHRGTSRQKTVHTTRDS